MAQYRTYSVRSPRLLIPFFTPNLVQMDIFKETQLPMPPYWKQLEFWHRLEDYLVQDTGKIKSIKRYTATAYLPLSPHFLHAFIIFRGAVESGILSTDLIVSHEVLVGLHALMFSEGVTMDGPSANGPWMKCLDLVPYHFTASGQWTNIALWHALVNSEASKFSVILGRASAIIHVNPSSKTMRVPLPVSQVSIILQRPYQ